MRIADIYKTAQSRLAGALGNARQGLPVPILQGGALRLAVLCCPVRLGLREGTAIGAPTHIGELDVATGELAALRVVSATELGNAPITGLLGFHRPQAPTEPARRSLFECYETLLPSFAFAELHPPRRVLIAARRFYAAFAAAAEPPLTAHYRALGREFFVWLDYVVAPRSDGPPTRDRAQRVIAALPGLAHASESIAICSEGGPFAFEVTGADRATRTRSLSIGSERTSGRLSIATLIEHLAPTLQSVDRKAREPLQSTDHIFRLTLETEIGRARWAWNDTAWPFLDLQRSLFAPAITRDTLYPRNLRLLYVPDAMTRRHLVQVELLGDGALTRITTGRLGQLERQTRLLPPASITEILAFVADAMETARELVAPGLRAPSFTRTEWLIVQLGDELWHVNLPLADPTVQPIVDMLTK